MMSFFLMDPVDLTVRATAVLLLTAAGAWLLRDRDAATRHRLWLAGLTGVLVLLPLGILLTRFGSTAVVSVPVLPAVPVEPASGPALGPVLMMGWLVGGLSVMLFLAWGRLSIHWATQRGQTVTTGILVAELNRAAGEFGVTGPVRVVVSDETPVPFVAGVIAPTVVMPRTWTTWPAGLVRSVMRHEAAHIARQDLLARTIGSVAVVLYWFHPLVWYADAKLRRSGELAADRLAAPAGPDAARYAGHLVELAASAPAALRPAMSMANRSGLETRVRALLDHRSRAGGPGVVSLLVAVAVAAACTSLADLTSPEEESAGTITAREDSSLSIRIMPNVANYGRFFYRFNFDFDVDVDTGGTVQEQASATYEVREVPQGAVSTIRSRPNS